MRITLFIIFCLLTLPSAIRAVSGDSNGVDVKEDKKIDSTDNPLNSDKIPLNITRKTASSPIPSLVVFAISAAALLILLVI